MLFQEKQGVRSLLFYACLPLACFDKDVSGQKNICAFLAVVVQKGGDASI